MYLYKSILRLQKCRNSMENFRGQEVNRTCGKPVVKTATVILYLQYFSPDLTYQCKKGIWKKDEKFTFLSSLN